MISERPRAAAEFLPGWQLVRVLHSEPQVSEGPLFGWTQSLPGRDLQAGGGACQAPQHAAQLVRTHPPMHKEMSFSSFSVSAVSEPDKAS